MKISATNHSSGEVIDIEVKTSSELVEAWQIAQEYSKVADRLKDQLKQLVPKYLKEDGKSEEINGYMFRATFIQRKNYDKTIMRNLLDQDTFDLLLKPDKPAIDEYLKENLESLGDISIELRNSMVDEGKPYEVIKLEKLTRG